MALKFSQSSIFMTGTSHLSNVADMSNSFDCQTNSVLFEYHAASPSQLLTDQGSIASEQEDVSSLDPPLSEPVEDEIGNSVTQIVRQRPQTNTSLRSAPVLEDEHSSGNSTTVEHAAALHSPDTAFTLLADIEWFRTYIAEDEQRCAEYNLPNPWLAPTAQAIMQKLAESSARRRLIFLKLWAGVCSSFSVVSLQETMQTLRSDMRAAFLPPNLNLSVNARLQVIENAEKCVAGLLLVRRLHVLQLLEDEPCAVNSGSWINVDMSTEGIKARKPGNPLNVQESEVTKSLLQRFYPDLSSSSEEYGRVYEKLKKLRRLGRRFQMLVSTFGMVDSRTVALFTFQLRRLQSRSRRPRVYTILA